MFSGVYGEIDHIFNETAGAMPRPDNCGTASSTFAAVAWESQS
jgi:hypothetical protein